MSDTLWWMLEHPEEQDYSRVAAHKDHVSGLFDPAVYERSRGLKFETSEAAYCDWKEVGRKSGAEFAEGKNTILKIILKVKDEPELIGRWIDYHGRIVGLHNLIILNCGSKDRKFLETLNVYRNQVLVFNYDRYYDHIHQYNFNKEFYDVVSSECKYLMVLDCDEFLFGASSRAIHPSYVPQVLATSTLPCVCATWFSNTTPPPEVDGNVDWTTPLAFGVEDSSLKWGSRQGKAIVSSNYVSEAKYVGHNIGDKRLSRFITADSFGKIGIFHLSSLNEATSKRRALHHLLAKGLVPENISAEEAERILKERRNLSTLKPVERRYIARYLGETVEPKLPQRVLQTRLLAHGAPETHEALSHWFDFDFGKLVDDASREVLSNSPT